jgi:predicted ATPase
MASETTAHGLLAEIALTGGPGGGKTLSLDFLAQELRARGYRVLVCPEIATMIYTGGVADVGDLAANQRKRYVATEAFLNTQQKAMREEYRLYADGFEEPVVIIYDRGELDCAAYLTPAEHRAMLRRHGLKRRELRDAYDAVIHLKTAAGTVYGDLSNNPGRRESSDAEALEADDRTLAVWKGHPHHYVIEAAQNFSDKLAAVMAAIDETLARLEAELAELG